MIAIRDLEMTKERLLSFAEYAKDAQPEVLVTLIQTIVERIYIVDRDDERYCHIFIKGCSGEDYTGFFQTAGYIEQQIKADVAEILSMLCKRKGIEIIEAECCKDHVHMLVRIPPNM